MYPRKNNDIEDDSGTNDNTTDNKRTRQRDPLNDAFRFIRYRARSEWEVENKLRQRGYSQEVIQKTISTLREKGFIDDEKFAYLYAYDSLTLHNKGPFRIRYELRQLHVDEYIIEDAINKVVSEVDVKEIIEKITEGLDERKRREKLYRQGFGGD
ncbi:MAG TPA: regulatory protein RecX [Fervidobacterium sp.]|nr:regulatory protein RecX [Fervidobacterium sp.]HRB91440.1 regulatory protein RecX [Fervidobacterium sp.]HRV37771.1 regulatory protein RecX [Fervidobacterium sp.]